MAPLRRVLTACLCCLATHPAAGHQTLYEAIEVNLHDPATIRVEFTIHAPELPTPLAAGVDPSAVDPAWLPGLDDAAIATLQDETTAFIRGHFSLRWTETTDPRDILATAPIRYEPLESIRRPPADTKLPPGCLLATVTLPNPGPPARLSVGYAEHGQKRLMLSVSRPAAFPEVRDVPPGGGHEIPLPVPPPPPASPFPWPAVVAAVAGMGALLLLRRRQCGTCQ
ncbi:MAG: hypothetical protein JNK37_20325 [Verrucomicrobiales bacterium]|nr:hypothetical protein [Verrucomicrobiales bacterium]